MNLLLVGLIRQHEQFRDQCRDQPWSPGSLEATNNDLWNGHESPSQKGHELPDICSWSIIATDLTRPRPKWWFSKGSTLISGHVGWWNIIIWSLGQIMFGFLGLKMFAYHNCWVCLRSELSWGLFTDLRPSSDGNLCFVGATHGGL